MPTSAQWPDGGSRVLGEGVQERITGKAPGTVGSGQLFRGKRTEGSRRRPWLEDMGAPWSPHTFLASVSGAQARWLKVGHDPEGWGVGRALRWHRGEWGPWTQQRLEQPDQKRPWLWPRKGLEQEITAGRSGEAADLWAGSEIIEGAGGFFSGCLVSQRGRKQGAAEAGGWQGQRGGWRREDRGSQDCRREPTGHAAGVTAGSSPGWPLRLPKLRDVGCLIISITVT